jgi:hypothetical protein
MLTVFILIVGSLLIVSRSGEKENICKYEHVED